MPGDVAVFLLHCLRVYGFLCFCGFDPACLCKFRAWLIHWHGPVFGEVAQPLTSLALNRYVRGHWPSSIFFPSTHAIPAAATQPGLHRQRRAHTSTNQQRGRMGWPGLYGQVYRKLAATCKARVQYRFHINHFPSLLCPKGGSILICRNLSTRPHVAHQWNLECHDWAGFRAFAWAEAATGIDVVALNWLQQLLLY